MKRSTRSPATGGVGAVEITGGCACMEFSWKCMRRLSGFRWPESADTASHRPDVLDARPFLRDARSGCAQHRIRSAATRGDAVQARRDAAAAPQRRRHVMKNEATVIGLGQMGATLARLLLEAGWRVTVWNRTAARADALVALGAVRAPDVLAAVRASDVVVVCVDDHAATRAILGDDAIAAAFRGRTLIELSTGGVQDAREADAWARARGADYLDGAIQAAPSQMGRPDTPILLSGAQAAWSRHEPLLRVFGGGLTWLGEDPGAAAAMDMATLSYIYGAMIGFLHGARIAEAEGIAVDRYGQLVSEIGPTFADFLRHEGGVIASGDFTVGESPLKISVEATARIARAAHDSGINDEFPVFVADLFRRAADAGYGNEEAAALVKVLRAPRPVPQGQAAAA
ncbi:NAD(P)-dependent oxidoreductase [Luteimonas salinilitoris]|uniref:NAD(P)-dependent oxidoreductase n=1 Tax=Luteimonas salinilitoris TaxID=3237697 RepID=A0ABV4HP90_9GAMM